MTSPEMNNIDPALQEGLPEPPAAGATIKNEIAYPGPSAYQFTGFIAPIPGLTRIFKNADSSYEYHSCRSIKLPSEHSSPSSASPSELTYANSRAKPPSDLIRNAPKPSLEDCSERALVIRVAQSKIGKLTDFTWTSHYGILYNSLHSALIAELNRKLAQNLTPRALLRDIDLTKVDDDLKPYVLFARAGTQEVIDWMWCAEHFDLMCQLDREKTELGLEELDFLVKATGVWMFKEIERE